MLDTNLLIQQWQRGDESAGEALYDSHRDRVFRLACGLLGDPADAEEVAQDALAYALSHITHYNPTRSRFTTWLHTITVSRCRDRQRRRRLFFLPLTKETQRGQDVRDPAPTPENQAIRAEAHSEVWAAVQALSPPLREAIVLRYWADHTFQEMAHILGCPVPTAQSRVRLAYQQLRVTLAPAARVGWEQEAV
jgi:RNA polymerase sigma-70 factor (ECF subfamily)